MAGKPGRWSGRPGFRQIEAQAGGLVAEFRHRLEEAGLTVPSIPPVPVEYLALTVTGLTLRGVSGLTADGKRLSGLLDPAREEICYEEADPPGRQSFSIAHELGHYFLHFRPPEAESGQASLFEEAQTESERTGYFRQGQSENLPRFYRCSENEMDVTETVKAKRLSKETLSDPAEQAKILQLWRDKERANRLEWEANLFARSLLMPTDLVRWLYTKYDGEVQAMAEELGVTQTALRYRLNGLGLRQDENMGLPKSRYKAKNYPPQNPSKQGTFL